MPDTQTLSAFVGTRLLATGSPEQVLAAVKERFDRDNATLFQIFIDQTGRQVDFDLRGTLDEVLVRALPERPRPGPGRPKLGVVAREVSLLPRHWEWLEAQPNGASAALRRLVEEARQREPDEQRTRTAIDAASRFLTAMAGDLPGYEEASRALYRRNGPRLRELIRGWPRDVRLHVQRLVRGIL